MVQKRKVKNLISVEKNNNSLLTTLLLLVGGVLCIGALGLLATSMLVKASTITYEGVDNKAEVVFDMSFVPENKLSGDVVDNMYLTGRTFYISGSSLVLTGKDNVIETGKNINILGGKNMNIDSKNISIIGGDAITIKTGNNNTTVLGGKGISISGNANPVPNVFLGGQSIQTQPGLVVGSAFIGGGFNEFLGAAPFASVKYGYILGGSNSKTFFNNDMVIIGGDKVYLDMNSSDVFVFNDGSVNKLLGIGRSYVLGKADGSDTFYLIVKNGVGLGMDALTGGVSSNGAVSLGDIDINLYSCNEANTGVIGAWDGCLVGCTSFGAGNGSKWEMVDHSESCKKKCKENGDKCIVTDSFSAISSSEEYSSSCVGEANVSRALQCHYNLISGYYDVVYEKKLIGANDNCPSISDENRCVFKCQKRYPNVTPDGKDCTDGNVRSCGAIVNSQGKCFGNNTYLEGGGTPTSWTYAGGKTCSELSSCEWNCSAGYVKRGNGCMMTVRPFDPIDPIDPRRPFDPRIDPLPGVIYP